MVPPSTHAPSDRRRKRPSWLRFVLGQVNRVRRSPESLLWTLRITAAATASYALASVLFDQHTPLVAPLTAMLVVQVTPVSLLTTGIERVAAVVVGVSVAVILADQFPLTWWSLALVIGASLLVGQALRVRNALVEVPISAMLVLGVGSFGAEAAAWERITESLVGATIAVATNLLFPPRVATGDAGRAIEDLGAEQATLLRKAAGSLRECSGDLSEIAGDSRSWLIKARGITRDVPAIDELLETAEASRRLNLSKLSTSDVSPGLKQGLEALEHTSVAVRAMFRSLADAVASDEWEPDQDDLALFARALEQLADLVQTFGRLVRDEAGRGAESARAGRTEVETLAEAVTALRATRSDLEAHRRAAEVAVDIELTVSILSTVRRLLRELDLTERMARQVQLHKRTRPRPRRVKRAPSADRGPVDPGAPTEQMQSKTGHHRAADS